MPISRDWPHSTIILMCRSIQLWTIPRRGSPKGIRVGPKTSFTKGGRSPGHSMVRTFVGQTSGTVTPTILDSKLVNQITKVDNQRPRWRRKHSGQNCDQTLSQPRCLRMSNISSRYLIPHSSPSKPRRDSSPKERLPHHLVPRQSIYLPRIWYHW